MAPRPVLLICSLGQRNQHEMTSLPQASNFEVEASRPGTMEVRTRCDMSKPRFDPRAVSPGPQLTPRGLSKPAKIGVPIGVVLGVGLLALCLYPVIARFFNKRRRHHLPFSGPGGLGLGGEDSQPGSTSATGTLEKEAKDSDLERRLPLHLHGRIRTFSRSSSKEGASASFAGASNVHHQQAAQAQPEASSQSAPSPIQVDTQMSGLGHSDSYYDTSIPSEAFGVDTSPGAWEAARHSSGWSGPTRTSTRMSFSSVWAYLQARGSKGSTSSPSTVIGPTSSSPNQAVISQHISESPTDLGPPLDVLFEPAHVQAQPAIPKLSPEDVGKAIQFPEDVSKPVLPPKQAAPGTVNPADAMRPTTTIEQMWDIEMQFMNMGNTEQESKTHGTSEHGSPSSEPTTPSPPPDTPSDPDSTPITNPSPQEFGCDQCDRTFDQAHKLNHHKRYHQRPHVCERPGCGRRFGTKTHLDRHINDKHEQTKKYYCTYPTCVFSRQGTKSFPRKDNLRRHMINIHGQSAGQKHEPDADEVMLGT